MVDFSLKVTRLLATSPSKGVPELGVFSVKPQLCSVKHCSSVNQPYLYPQGHHNFPDTTGSDIVAFLVESRHPKDVKMHRLDMNIVYRGIKLYVADIQSLQI